MANTASVITNGIDGENPPPGLTSVASATGTLLVDQHAGGREATELEVEGRGRQQRGDHAARAAIARAASSVDEDQMVGGRARRFRPRRSEPPLSASSSAWMRGRSPCRSPASRMRRDSSGVKTPCSQKTSHHSARPSRGDRRNHLVDDEPT